jgi:hypothetical protein
MFKGISVGTGRTALVASQLIREPGLMDKKYGLGCWVDASEKNMNFGSRHGQFCI